MIGCFSLFLITVVVTMVVYRTGLSLVLLLNSYLPFRLNLVRVMKLGIWHWRFSTGIRNMHSLRCVMQIRQTSRP